MEPSEAKGGAEEKSAAGKAAHDGQHEHGIRRRSRRAGETITKADFAPWLALRDARGRMGLACSLEAVAGQASALLRSLANELFHVYQSLPGFRKEFERIAEIEKTVSKLSVDLEYGAGNKLADALSDVLDCGGGQVSPPLPKGISAAEFLVIEEIERHAPQGATEDDLRDKLVREFRHDLSEEDFNAVLDGLAERGLIAPMDASVKPGARRMILAGPLKGGLR